MSDAPRLTLQERRRLNAPEICFGPFTLDAWAWSLSRNGRAVDLSPRLVQILACLIERHGGIVTKDELFERFWRDVTVTENTLTRAIADIRKALGDDAAEPRYVQTNARRGYRFVAEIAETPAVPSSPPAPSAGVDVFQDWVKGRLALESLDETRLPDACRAFERAVAELPQYAPAHAGLASAYLLRFEASRICGSPDPALIASGVACARESCRLDPQLGEGWAALGHLLTLAQEIEGARAFTRRAVSLEPDNWRHQFRLAFATWGEERLRAVDRTLALMPACAAAHMLAAMVFVARGALAAALASAVRGAELQEAQSGGAPLPGAGCSWLAGLICLALDDGATGRARGYFEREVAAEQRSGLYGREFAGRARAEIRRLDRHEPLAGAGEDTIANLAAMLSAASPGPTAWNIPIDPAFAHLRGHPRFAQVLRALAARAA